MGKARSLVLDSLTGLTAVAALLLAWKALVPSSAPGQPFETREIRDWDSHVSAGRHIGSESPIMTILEWGDYECPGCVSYHAALSALLEEFPDEVAVVYRHWPLTNHRFAYGAARAAECAAAQDRFEQLHDLMFETGSLDERSLLELGAEAGIADHAAFRDCMTSDFPVERIEADIAAIKELEGWGTPSVAVNGVLFGRPPTPEKLREMLSKIREGRSQ